MNTPNQDLEKKFYELVCYMVTSARNLVAETKLYGPFRLVDSASRLVEILPQVGVDSVRLRSIRRQIEDGKYTVMEDESTFSSYLESLVMALVQAMDE